MTNFAYTEFIDGPQAIFEGDEFHHQIKVLRRCVGENINFLDGLGKRYQGKILAIDNRKKRFQVEITKCDFCHQPLPLQLMVALPKSSKIETIIQKAVELGVSQITPLLTTRTIVKVASEEKRRSRQQHWQRIAIASLKQSGNPYLPVIDQPTALIDLDKNEEKPFPVDKIAFHPHAPLHFSDTVANLDKGSGTRLLLGPEGGFSEDEINLLSSKNYIVSSFGKRVMRLETAVVATLVLVNFVKGR